MIIVHGVKYFRSSSFGLKENNILALYFAANISLSKFFEKHLLHTPINDSINICALITKKNKINKGDKKIYRL